MADEIQIITIDGDEYNLVDLSENARHHLVNLRVTDAVIDKRSLQAIYRTACTAYARAVYKELPKTAH